MYRWLLILLSFNVYAEEMKPVGNDLTCLAKNIYFEARGEPMAGKIAVAMITLNRVKSKRWPNTICGVTWQPKQFSWTWDGLSDSPTDLTSWEEAKYIASVALKIHKVKDSTHYHNLNVFPKWADSNKYTGYIENHMFYK